MTKENLTTYIVKLDGEEYPVYRKNNDINGNPVYLIHFLTLGLKEYKATDKTRAAGLKKFNGKIFGGGFTFQSYNLEDSLKFIISKVK